MKYVVIGSGLAGVTVAEGLAKNGRGEVHLVTRETRGYYARPRLSHGFACSDEQAARIFMKPFEAFAPAIRVHSGTRVLAIDRSRKRLVLEVEETLAYDVLVLATGSAARVPAALQPDRAAFFTLNSFDDLAALRERRRTVQGRGERPRWAIVGGGLIGCELASDLAKAGDALTVFHAGSRLLERVLDERQSQALHEHFRQRGVDLRYEQNVRTIAADGARTSVLTGMEEMTGFHGAVLCTGFAPRIELAQRSGLTVGRGIVVDRYLATADPAIYAAGDVAEVGSTLFPFVSPIRSQSLWLVEHLSGRRDDPWQPPQFAPVIKIHDFKVPLPASIAA